MADIQLIQSAIDSKRAESAALQKQLSQLNSDINNLCCQLNEDYADAMIGAIADGVMYSYCDSRGVRSEPKNSVAIKDHIVGNMRYAAHVGYSVNLHGGVIVLTRPNDVDIKFWLERVESET